MRTAAILPVKSLRPRQAAPRAPRSRPVAREALAAGDGLRRARRAGRRGGPRRRWWSPPSRGRPSAPARVGATVLDDPSEAGQSAAALLGIEPPRADGRRARAARPGRLPGARPGRAGRAARRSAACAVVIVPDRHGTGTNALLLAPPDAIVPGVRARLASRATRRCAAPPASRSRWSSSPSLAHDVDTPADLAALRAALDRPARRRPAHRGPLLARLAPPRRRVIAAIALPGLPEVRPGRRPRRAARAAAGARSLARRPTCSRSPTRSSPRPRGACVALADVDAGRARARAGRRARQGPALVQVVLDETRRAAARRRRPADRAHPARLRVRERRRRQLQRGRRGDRRPAPARPRRLGARALRARLGCAVVITDSFGRAWRIGPVPRSRSAAPASRRSTTGAGGPTPTAARCTRRTSRSPTRSAAAADLARGKDSREPAVRLRGLERHVLAEDGPGRRGAACARPTEDLFR